MTFKSCCFSGYRPSKFSFKLQNGNIDFEVFLRNLKTTLKSLVEDDCRNFYCGMAMGFDIIAAEAVLELKKTENALRLIAVIPFKEQQNGFKGEWQDRYDKVIKLCDEVIILSENYHNGCYQQRNKFMVDSSDYVVTWYDGKNGGTRNTLSYAAKKKRYIVNINTEYVKEFTNSQLEIKI